MAEIVNLRTMRKRARRSENEKSANAQRVTHGTPKALRQEIDARRDKAQRNLDAHRLSKRDE